MMNKAQEFWDKQAGRFDESEKQFESASHQLIAMTKEYLGSNDIVLDFGCATGTKTIELAEAVRQIHGIDYSGEMIKEATKKKTGSNAGNVTFSQGTIFNNDLEKASFDRIIAYAILHLLEDSEKATRRIHELLKPGGLFISTIPCFREKMNLKTRMQVIINSFMQLLGVSPLHLNMYTTSDIEQLITRNNFSIVTSEKMFFNGISFMFLVAEKQ